MVIPSHPAHIAHAHAVWAVPRPRHLHHPRSWSEKHIFFIFSNLFNITCILPGLKNTIFSQNWIAATRCSWQRTRSRKTLGASMCRSRKRTSSDTLASPSQGLSNNKNAKPGNLEDSLKLCSGLTRPATDGRGRWSRYI